MAEDLFQAIYHPLAISGKSARLRQETDYEAYIRQLIRQVLLTAPGERINRPEFGAGVRRLVFAPLQPGHRITGTDHDLPGAGHLAGQSDPGRECDRRSQRTRSARHRCHLHPSRTR